MLHYTLDDRPIDLVAFLRANREALLPAELRSACLLRPGQLVELAGAEAPRVLSCEEQLPAIAFPVPVEVLAVGEEGCASPRGRWVSATYAELVAIKRTIVAEDLFPFLHVDGHAIELPTGDPTIPLPWGHLRGGWVWLGSGECHDPARGCCDAWYAHVEHGLVRQMTVYARRLGLSEPGLTYLAWAGRRYYRFEPLAQTAAG